MAKVGIFAALNYKLNVQHGLRQASYQNMKVQDMANSVPASVYCHWRDTANVEFPGLKTTPANFAVAASALLQFFHMTAIEKAPMMLPSKAADSVWHTWMAHDQAGLTSFLKTHLGQDIPHVEKNAMPEQGPSNPITRMADTWRAAHDYDNNAQFSGKLPSIFEADKVTGIPTGFWYDRDPEDRRAGRFHDMDGKGVPNPEPQGQRMLAWPHIYEVMTPARRAKSDAEIVRHYEEPAGISGKHAAVLAGLGIAVDALEKKDKELSGGDGGSPYAFGSSSSDDGGSSCGGGGGGCGG